jgi:hypothetical protein
MSMNTWNSQVLKNLVRFRAWNVDIFWRSRFLGTASQQVWGLMLRKALRQHRLGEEVEACFCFQQSSLHLPKGQGYSMINPGTYWNRTWESKQCNVYG